MNRLMKAAVTALAVATTAAPLMAAPMTASAQSYGRYDDRHDRRDKSEEHTSELQSH